MYLGFYKSHVSKMIAEVIGVNETLITPLVKSVESSKDKECQLCLAINKLKRFNIDTLDISNLKTDEFINKWDIKTYKQHSYLNITLNPVSLCRNVLLGVYQLGEKYGSNKLLHNQKIVVEYSSPNIAKPFHAGHLRSTIIGNFINNLYKFEGADTVSINYLGDWGKQYGLLAIGYEKYGSSEKLQTQPIKHLFDIYVQINEDAGTSSAKKDKKTKYKQVDTTNSILTQQDNIIQGQARAHFLKMEQGDQHSLELWNKFRDLSIIEYKKIYNRLGVAFDVYSGESQQNESMKRALQLIKDKGLITIGDNGEQLIDLTQWNLGKVLLTKKDGGTLYITRDIGAAISRYEQYKFNKMVYVVASAQDLHFKQLFKILELIGCQWTHTCQHVNFGLVNGMSTRNGTVVFLEDILNQAQHIMLHKMNTDSNKLEHIIHPETVADNIGISSIIIGDLSAKRIKNYEFSWDRVTSFEGYTGPYLQYNHARLCNILDMNRHITLSENINYSLLHESEAINLVCHIAQFNDIISQCLHTLEPNTLVTYLFELSNLISLSHQKLWVKNQPNDIAQARLLLFYCAKCVLSTGLRILGLHPIEKM